MRALRKASDIKLRLVGKRTYEKPPRAISVAELHYSEPRLLSKNSNFCKSELFEQPSSREISDQKYSAIEDTRVSRFSHNKILIVQKNILLLSLLVIFFGMMKLQADGVYPSGAMSQKIMMIMSCVTAVLILLIVIRKVLTIQLDMDQKKFYIRKDNRKLCKSSLLLLLSYRKETVMLITEILAILPHPNALCVNATYSYFNQNYQADLKYSLNDLLSVLMLAKIYLVFRSLVTLTIYSSPRMIRLCRHKDFQYSFFYSIKCIQYEHPIFFIAFTFTITLFIFAFGFRVTEGRVYFLNGPAVEVNGYQNYPNCLWYTFITMTSLGYGDYTPNTTIARMLACMLMIFGLTLNSFLVVAFSEYLKMKSQEIRSHTTLLRLFQHKKLQKDSAVTFAEIIKVSHSMSRQTSQALMARRLKPMFNELKRKIDNTKTQSHRIRAILPQENKTELMIHEFQVLKDNFKSLYQRQKRTKNKIVRMQQKKDIRAQARESFLKEVKTLLNKFK